MIREILYKIFRIEPFPCASCETLRAQLEFVNFEKKSLLDFILEKNRPTESAPMERPEPIIPKTIPWNVKQRMLEQEDRARAQILRKQKQTVEELEKEVLAVGTENN